MTNLVYSAKKNRWYERKFDHDKARRLHLQGMAIAEIARRLGVSATAVDRVTNPERARQMDEQTKKFMWKHRRKPCKGGCGRLVWTTEKGRTGMCLRCVGKLQTRNEVREGELKCKRCGEWKPDEEFPLAKFQNRKAGRVRGGISRRYRHSWCRPCSAAVRREHRQRFPGSQQAYDRRRELDRKEDRRQNMEYVVLRKEEDGVYRDVGHAETTSADTAIEEVADQEGEYVAVSLARFEVVEVAPTTSLRVRRET